MRPIRTVFSFLIVTVHLGCLILFYSNKPPLIQSKKRLVVKTLVPPNPIQQPIVRSVPIKPVATCKPKQRKKKTPPPKKVPPKPKPTPVKKNTPQSKPKQAPVKKSTSQSTIPQNLLNQLEESIAKIDQNDHKVNSKSRLTVPMLDLKSSDKRGLSEISFHQRLIECLHRSLSLPDHGEVTIELKLNSNGLIAELNVLKTESAKNRAYLEKHLPQVIFPPLEGNDFKKEQRKFIFTFCNEI